MLLHRQLRDSVPVNPKFYRPHKEWVVSAKEREIAYAKRNEGMIARYNQTAHPLKELEVQTTVLVQEGGKWRKTGRIVEALPNRQYKIRMEGSGRIVLRNRKFLKTSSGAANVDKNASVPSFAEPALEGTKEEGESLDINDQENSEGIEEEGESLDVNDQENFEEEPEAESSDTNDTSTEDSHYEAEPDEQPLRRSTRPRTKNPKYNDFVV